jgi:mRNA interferase MazF
MEKFEIWTVAGGEHTNKPRPCMIIQSAAISLFETIIIAPITTFESSNSVYRIALKASPQTGLLGDSFLELEKISAIKKKYLGKRIGSLTGGTRVDVNQAIAKLFAIDGQQ